MSSQKSSRFSALALTVFALLFSAAFFLLPYAFPVAPSVSASYVFQYNNRVATLIFLAAAVFFALYFRGPSLTSQQPDSRISRGTALLTSLAATLAGAIFYWLSTTTGLQGESIYFYDRLALLNAGKTIYRDFEFVYGPLWLYLPLWTGKLLHLNLIHGYIVFWLSDWAVGVLLIYKLINAIEIPSLHRRAIFFIVVLYFANAYWAEGINFAPIRFIFTSSLAMIVHAAYKRGYPPVAIALTAVACAAFGAAISPEHGIAFMLGTLVFFVFGISKKSRQFWLCIPFVALCFLAIVVASEKALVYTTLHAFASGANNYPILPDLGVLSVLAVYFMAASVAYRLVLQEQKNTLAFYLLGICLFVMPSAFGRADVGHMQIGIAALIIGGLAISNYRRVAPWMAVAYLGTAILFPQLKLYVREAKLFREQIKYRTLGSETRLAILHAPAVLAFRLAHKDGLRQEVEAKIAAEPARDFSLNLPPGTVVNAPLSFSRNGYADDSGQVDYGYFVGLEDAILPSQVDAIIHWLQAHPERSLIIPAINLDHWSTYDESTRKNLKDTFSLPFAPRPKREMLMYEPLFQFIRQNYAPGGVEYPNGAFLWHPITHNPPH